MLNRRELLTGSLLAAAAGPTLAAAQAPPPPTTAPVAPVPAPSPAAVDGPYQLPALPWAVDALEPHLDARTVEIHHDRHHAAYVKNLNAALADLPDLAKLPVEELVAQLDRVPEAKRQAVRNHGGGHANHALFWRTMSPKGAGRPVGELAAAIDRRFGSQARLETELVQAALGVFGSGWAWLSRAADGSLAVETSPNQDSPWMAGRTPLVGVDVWEHAYYLKFQNRRADYLAAWLKVVDWEVVSARYRAPLPV